MDDYRAFRSAAIRYWERRRVLYNFALALSSFVSYMMTGALVYVGDPHRGHYAYVFSLFVLCAVGANICYLLVYALEFLFGSEERDSSWLQYGRPLVFVAGVIFAMGLAFVGAGDIAWMEFARDHRN